MSAAKNTFRGTRPMGTEEADEHRHVGLDAAVAASLCTLAVIVFLALISFDTRDLPAWTGRNECPEPVSPALNFIGPVGALVAMASYLLFGAGAFFLPVGLVWLGLLKLIDHARMHGKVIAGWALLLVSTSALIHIQKLFLHGKGTVFDRLVGSPGGFVGELVGGMLLQNLMGTVGATLVLVLVYAVALPLFTGLNPVQFVRMNWAALRRHLAARRLAAAERRADRAALGPDAPGKTKRTRPPRGGGEPSVVPDEAAEGTTPAAPELPLEFAPQRRIIDASVRGPRKPGARSLLFPDKKKQTLESAQFPGYLLPGLDLLAWNDPADDQPADKKELISTQETLIQSLASFGIEVQPGDITRGPTVTRYEVYPRAGLRVNRIAQLEADIARSTRAERIHIIAPIPGKDTVGIEIANQNKVLVPLRELVEDPGFANSKKKIPLALGKDVYGNVVVGDLAAMPHLLVAGATGSGKSVCINSIIASMLFRFSPDELRLIMIDPKVVEMADYNTLPHLVAPVVTDPRKVVQALRWVVNEMERRYRLFAKVAVRNFEAFNKRPPQERKAAPPAPEPVEVDEEAVESIARALEDGELLGPDADEAEAMLFAEEEVPDRIPYIVVIIDELADLMQTASADVEMLIARIAQKARAAGIHLIIATQTPRSTVITGVIKANIPCRIAFQVSSGIDSRVILDTNGAEKLVGKGDMLYLPPGSATHVRCQGSFITDEEVHQLVKHCSGQGQQRFEAHIEEALAGGPDEEGEEVTSEDEEMLEKCIEVILQEKRASTSLLQRRLRLGYTRAARMMDLLEQRGYVGPGDGAKPREVLLR